MQNQSFALAITVVSFATVKCVDQLKVGFSIMKEGK